jgi:hypothetical protein
MIVLRHTRRRSEAMAVCLAAVLAWVARDAGLGGVVLAGGVGDSLVEEVAVAFEGDEWVGVAGDCLDEFDVGAGGDEAADAGVAEVVEAVERFAVGLGELCFA